MINIRLNTVLACVLLAFISFGFPEPERAQRARQEEAFQRAVTAYRFWYPTVSAQAGMEGFREQGVADNLGIAIMATNPRQNFFTGNSDTPYGVATLDLSQGPMVVELPPGRFVGLAMDHNQSWLLDMGLSGPDQGKGGRHLILPPDYQERGPDGYNMAQSMTLKVQVAIRALPAGSMSKREALESLRAIKIYPLANSEERLKFFDLTDNSLVASPVPWESNIKFWEKLAEVISSEPLVDTFAPMYGELKALGIEKGKKFNPSEATKALLEKAASEGRDQMLVGAFASNRPERLPWADRKWEWVSLSDDFNFENSTGLDLRSRERWFIQAVGNSPTMLRRSEGAGSIYWLSARDSEGIYLDGGKTYKLTIPLPVPAQLFWSVTVYDPETRSQLQTAQRSAALSSLYDLKDIGSNAAEIYFGPAAPEGKSRQWIQTTPGKGWFAYFRIYGPTAAAFNQGWKLGDIEEVR